MCCWQKQNESPVFLPCPLYTHPPASSTGLGQAEIVNRVHYLDKAFSFFNTQAIHPVCRSGSRTNCPFLQSTDLSFQCWLCVSACEGERGNEWICLFNYLNTHRAQQEGRGAPVPPAEALQLSRRGIAPLHLPADPVEQGTREHSAKKPIFICFDHQPCSLTTQNRSLFHLHTPPSGRLLRGPGPAGRAQLPPGLGAGLGAGPEPGRC